MAPIKPLLRYSTKEDTSKDKQKDTQDSAAKEKSNEIPWIKRLHIPKIRFFMYERTRISDFDRFDIRDRDFRVGI